MLKVSLLAYTPNPEFVVAQAARLCYSASSIEEIGKNLTDDKVKSFIDMLSSLGHYSPFEHASFTFGIEGVSRSLLAQITRHRIASYSVQSQRYVNLDDFSYITPPEILKSKAARDQFELAIQRAKDSYNKIVDILKMSHKQALIDEGMGEKQAEHAAQKLANEDARFVLPNACETKMICTFNARSLQNFFKERCCNRAQWEIRALACEMLKLVLEVAPNLFKNSGPACLTGACPEGKMSCGKSLEVREKFRRLKEKDNGR